MSTQDLHALRTQALTEAFGAQASGFAGLLDDTAKVAFDSYKYKVTANKPIHAKRAALAKLVPQFWTKALNNNASFVPFIDPVDKEALEFLEDVWIEHNEEDPRDFEIRFTFSAKNPYFKDTVLAKKVTSTPPSTSDAPGPAPHDLDAPSYTSSTKINWTSPEHDLTKKAPKINVAELEGYDEFEGHGSFFNWFGESGLDQSGLADDLLDWWANAMEFAAGMTMPEDDSDDEGLSGDDDEDEDSEDGAKEIDLESEDERPKKKSKK